MFKKTLLATAILATTFGAAAVTTVGPAAVDVSSQGVPLTKAYTLPSVVVTINAADVSALTAGAKVKLTFTGAFVSATTGAPSYTDTGTDTTTDGVLGAPTITSTTMTAAFTTDAAGGTIAGDTITFTNIPLLLASAAVGSEVKVTASITSSSDVVVGSTTSVSTKVAAVVNQWSAGLVADVTADPTVADVLNAQIDVGDNRETFLASAPGTASTDVLTFDANTVTSVVTATATGLTLKLKGDFTGVKSVTGKTGADAAVTYAIDTNKTEASYTYAAGATTAAEALNDATTITVALNTVTADKVSLETRSFTFDATAAYNDAEAQAGSIKLLENVSAGKWTLNGVSKTVEYIPYGPNTQMIIQATSTFAEDASVTVSYQNEALGKMVTLTDVATVKANAVTKLGGLISDAIMADSGTASGKTRMVITINAPTGKVTLFTGFKDTNDADRLAVPNS